MRSIWKKSAMKTAAILPGVRRVVQLRDQLWGDLRSFVMSTPAKPRHLPVRSTSSGTRGSAVPGFETGSASLFDDIRIKWLEAQLGSFSKQRGLELGPLEGGHTCMMEHAGASVVAIEAN